jgi:hypothetical protein
MFFTPNLVIGLTIMSVGVVLLLDTLGIRDAGSMLRYWPFLIVLFGASLVAQAFRPVDPAAPRRGNGGAPCFFLFLLGVAMFATFGFPFSADTNAASRRASATSVMGNSRTTVTESDTRHGRVAAVMGRSSLDLRQLNLGPGEVMTVDVFVAMGNALVRIPDTWVVDASAMPVMGAINERRFPPSIAVAPGTPPPGEWQAAHDRRNDRLEREAQGDVNAAPPPPPSGPPPRLRLRGFVMMGKVDVSS